MLCLRRVFANSKFLNKDYMEKSCKPGVYGTFRYSRGTHVKIIMVSALSNDVVAKRVF